MGNTCCGYISSNRHLVSAPVDVNELQNNIDKLVIPSTTNLQEPPKPQDSDKIPKAKYDAFEVIPEGMDSSNLQSQENNFVLSNNTVNTNNKNKAPVKNQTKEFLDETNIINNNIKLHIDLSVDASVEQNSSNNKVQKSQKKSITGKNNRKSQAMTLINLHEIKLSEETKKKLTFLKEKSDKEKDQNGVKSSLSYYKRSQTINANANGEINNNNDSEMYEQSEKTKHMEDIKMEFLEDKRKLDKKQSERNLFKKSSRNTNRSRNDKESPSPKNEEGGNKKHEEPKRVGTVSPKKSLLKRAKTIGEDLKGDKNVKKKVKFKDLDMKAKKRRK